VFDGDTRGGGTRVRVDGMSAAWSAVDARSERETVTGSFRGNEAFRDVVFPVVVDPAK
jgi:hypothetical protein